MPDTTEATTEEARLNAKYGAFVVTALDWERGCSRPVGKTTYATIREALDGAARLDRRFPDRIGGYSIDVAPSARAAAQ